MFDVARTLETFAQDPDQYLEQPLPEDVTVDDIISILSSDPRAILETNVWEASLGTQKYRDEEWVDAIAGGVKFYLNEAVEALNASNVNEFEEIGDAIAKYCVLIHIQLSRFHTIFSSLEQETHGSTTAAMAGQSDRKRQQAILQNERFRSTSMSTRSLLRAGSHLLSLQGLERILSVRSVRSSIVREGLVKPTLTLFAQESAIADNQLHKEITTLLSLSIKLHKMVSPVQIQCLHMVLSSETSVDAVIQLCREVMVEYDSRTLVDNLLRDLGEHEWDDQRQAKGASAFLQKVVEIMPEVIIQQLPIIQSFFTAGSPQLRQAALEAAGAVIKSLSRLDEEETSRKQLDVLVALVEEHTNDVAHFCRLRTLTILAQLVDFSRIRRYRHGIMDLAVQKMSDRSQQVRAAAMRLVQKLLETHPFKLSGTQSLLTATDWSNRLEALRERINTLGFSTESEDNERMQLEMMEKFHEDALEFIGQLDQAMDLARSLLRSKSKSDIIDAIDLLVYADAFGVESTRAGINQMVHLVWTKADNDETNAVCKHAVKSYCDLFLSANPELAPDARAWAVAENLVGQAKDASDARMTSMQQLLGYAMNEDRIEPRVLTCLWRMYQQAGTSSSRAAGAVMVLSMLAAHNPQIALTGLDEVILTGLGPAGENDYKLAKFSCALIRRAITPAAFRDGTASNHQLSSSHQLFSRLRHILSQPAKTFAWFGMAKEAIGVMTDVCVNPEDAWSGLLKNLVANIWPTDEITLSDNDRQVLLAQLAYCAGEVCISMIMLLERLQAAYKKSYSEAEELEKQRQASNEPDDDELAKMGGGSLEETFAEMLRYIREREVLYSDSALLRPFAKLISRLVFDECEQTMNHPFLSIAICQSLPKFMCVSDTFCREHADVAVHLMATHSSPVVRSNLVIGLSDTVVCFNNIMDVHMGELYGRLNDEIPMVQRTTIVALTFLILAGKVKVKGRLGEMAKAMENPDPKIAALATMFFRELATKERSIYNAMLDLLSSLANDDSLMEPAMRKILAFLAKFVDKERHVKSLVEKLVARLPKCTSRRQWNATVAVLENLPGKLDDSVVEKIKQGYRSLPGEADDEDVKPIIHEEPVTQQVEQFTEDVQMPDLEEPIASQ